jgi:hypothetical protein
MSRPWVDNEDGPDCTCGDPTVVKAHPNGYILLCLFHTGAEGQFMKLPEEAPDNWEALTIEQVRAL